MAHAEDIFRTLFGGNDPFAGAFAQMFEGMGKGGGKGGGGFPGGMMFQFGPGMDMDGMMGGGMPGMGMPGGGRGMPGGMGGRRGSGSAPSQAPPPPHAIPKGTQVVVRGLEKAPEHNGRTGTVTNFDDGKGRYEV